jgi:L-malate glycosyltransferase
MTIAGHREFWVPGKLIEKINLLLFRNISAITVTGEKTRNYLVKNRFSPEKVFILPNVIDFENFYLNSTTKKEFNLISISRLDKNKNISLLLRAIAKVKVGRQIKALIAGVGEERNNLIQEAKMLGIEGNVHFAGWVEEEDKNDLYNKSEIFVLCSKGEGCPLALLEAMACGCVPVVSDVGDISDVVINEENGIIYNDVDHEEELAKIIKNLVSHPERMLKMSVQARDIKNKLSFDNVSKIWDNILSTIKF